MRSSNKYNQYINTVLLSHGIPENQAENIAKDATPELQKMENRNNISRAMFTVFIVVLFTISYAVTIYFLFKISDIETELIKAKLLLPAERAITKETIMAMLAATSTQVGLAFYAVTKYLFSNTENSATAKTP